GGRRRARGGGGRGPLGAAPGPGLGGPGTAALVPGDGWCPAGPRREGCRIVDSNSLMLTALVARDGGEPRLPGILPDRRDVLREALAESSADLVLVSGGTSVGQEDHAPSLLAELAELPLPGAALRPASPTGVGFLGDRPVFLLPGNPVSCLCAYDLFAGRAVRFLGNLSPEMPYRTARLPLAGKVSSAVGRVDYV